MIDVPRQAGSRTAAVIGGSMAGLFAALRLRRAGWQVVVFERAREELTGRGAGINTHPELLQALAAVGAPVGLEAGVQTQWRRLLQRDGRTEREIRYPQISTSWDALLALLRRPLPSECYRLGQTLVGLREDADKVALDFAGGHSFEADLVVGADGFRSTVRGLLFPGVDPVYAGYVAWRALVDEAALSPEAHRVLFDAFVIAIADGEEILGYPVAGPNEDLRPGRRRYNLVWYRRADSQDGLSRLLTDVHGIRHEISIPPPLIAPAVIAEMRAAARSKLPPVLAEVMAGAAVPFLQPIYDLECPAMVSGRCILIGDAAFVARPHVGAGVTKAAYDALALGDALESHGGLSSALADAEAQRMPVNRRMVAKARRLGRVLISTDGEVPSHEEVLTDTASLRWLDREAVPG